jgi:uncharacterized protein (DUF362 family)
MTGKKETVIVRRLQSPHQRESFTDFLPLNDALKNEVFAAVGEIFDAAGGKSLLKKSGDVYIKPNGIDSKPYCYTRPELVEAVIRYWKGNGAKNIYLFENSTQGNFTRMVFALTGYANICRRFGVKQVFLDEEKNVTFEFRGKKPEGAESEEKGYRQSSFLIPEFIVKRLIERKDENLYINLPKLKTHSMAEVTLGVKNQWAFPQQKDRRADHNYNLPHKLADVLGYIQPDFTLIEGIEGTVYGHYPVTAFADECVIPFKVLIGSKNVVAADMAGAKVLGIDADKVEHLRIAARRGYSGGVSSLEDIDLIGNISDFVKVYPSDLIPRFPDDVRVISGTERLCREGCKNNPLTVLQTLYYDYGGKGGWTLLMGKGHSAQELDSIRGKVLIAGHCAIAETADMLIRRLGKKNVYFSGHCNDLCATLNAMCHLMKVSPLKLAPLPLFTALKLLALAKLHGSRASIPNFLANYIKTAEARQGC